MQWCSTLVFNRVWRTWLGIVAATLSRLKHRWIIFQSDFPKQAKEGKPIFDSNFPRKMFPSLICTDARNDVSCFAAPSFFRIDVFTRRIMKTGLNARFVGGRGCFLKIDTLVGGFCFAILRSLKDKLYDSYQNIFWWLPDGLRNTVNCRKVMEPSKVQQTAVNWWPQLQTKETKTNWSRQIRLEMQKRSFRFRRIAKLFIFVFLLFFSQMQNSDFSWKYSTFYDVFIPKTPMIARVKFFHRNNGVDAR